MWITNAHFLRETRPCLTKIELFLKRFFRQISGPVKISRARAPTPFLRQWNVLLESLCIWIVQFTKELFLSVCVCVCNICLCRMWGVWLRGRGRFIYTGKKPYFHSLDVYIIFFNKNHVFFTSSLAVLNFWSNFKPYLFLFCSWILYTPIANS